MIHSSSIIPSRKFYYNLWSQRGLHYKKKKENQSPDQHSGWYLSDGIFLHWLVVSWGHTDIWLEPLSPPPHGGGYVLISTGLFMCLLATLRENGWMGFDEIFMQIGHDKDKKTKQKNKLEHFRNALYHHTDTCFFLLLGVGVRVRDGVGIGAY